MVIKRAVSVFSSFSGEREGVIGRESGGRLYTPVERSG